MSERVNFYYNPGGELTGEQTKTLTDAAYNIRVNAIKLISRCNWGHPGGSLSVADALAVLIGGGADIAGEKCTPRDKDFVVLSKAHCSPALYSAFLEYGLIGEDLFYRYGQVGGLEGHLSKGKPGCVDANGGSLGLGLSYCVGVAQALKMRQNYKRRVFCVCGDGELSEGQMWEAAIAASQRQLDNLIVMVDFNKVMAKGYLYEETDLEPLNRKWDSFGFNVVECDGHDVRDIARSLYLAKYRYVNGKPTAILLHTAKGRGVDDCEFNYKWHTHAPNQETANGFLKKLAQAYGKDYRPIESVVKGADSGVRGIVEE